MERPLGKRQVAGSNPARGSTKLRLLEVSPMFVIPSERSFPRVCTLRRPVKAWFPIGEHFCLGLHSLRSRGALLISKTTLHRTFKSRIVPQSAQPLGKAGERNTLPQTCRKQSCTNHRQLLWGYLQTITPKPVPPLLLASKGRFSREKHSPRSK